VLVHRGVDEETGATKRSVGRPSKAQPFRRFVIDLLLDQPNLRSLEIVRRAREAGYDGGKSALYSLIASVRPRRSRPLSEHEKVPGEIARHGFGQVDVTFRDGRTRAVTVFVSRLEYSRFAVASVVADQSVETCARALVAHYGVAGGVPLLAAFDRVRPLGLGSDKDGKVTEWDPAFAYVALQLGLGVEVRARRGADRGPGTNLGNWLKLGFFKDGSFADEGDLARQLTEWVRAQNELPQAESGGRSASVLLAEERQRLRPLKVEPNDLALRFPVLVGPRGSVIHDGQAYAMPAESVGLAGALYLYPDRVTIVVGRHQTTHPRHPQARPEPVPAAASVAPAAASSPSWGPRVSVPLAARGVV
jgi:hypothetical protein